MLNKQHYVEILDAFLDHGYSFEFFSQTTKPKRTIYLRHDIDFCPNAALALAELEAEKSIFSTFYFMLSCSFYNALEEHTGNTIRRIRDLGHDISLHFDPELSQDYEARFELEKAAFEKNFDVTLDLISLHRPRDFLQNNNRLIGGHRHTYNDAYFKNIDYVSDSGGRFKYGHPLDSKAYQEGQSLQLLIHPIWWEYSADTPTLALQKFKRSLDQTLADRAKENCLTFEGEWETS